jgi:uncharacterized protein (TIGR00251 family)
MKTGRNYELHDGKFGAAITVRVTPRMARNEITEIMNDGTVKIRLTAPPVDGRANQGLVEFLSEILGVRPAKIEIISGLTARDKIVTVMDITPEDLQARILQHLC